MKEVFSLIRNDKILNRFYLFSFFLVLATVIYILIVYRNLPPIIPLYNQLPWGDNRLGPTIEIFFPDLVVMIILVINLTISGLTYKGNPLISRLLAVTCFLIAILTFLFIFRTTQIVL